MKLDFFARRDNYVDHLSPIWKIFPEQLRGNFFVDQRNFGYAIFELGTPGVIIYNGYTPAGQGPILTCAYGDMSRAARNEGRKIISMEHGTGHTFGTASYPDGQGRRSLVSLALMPNEFTANKARVVRDTHCEIIGTPKTDELIPPSKVFSRPVDKPVIAIGFHWGDRKSSPPESGSAWEHYKIVLPVLKAKYGENLIAHGHPLSWGVFRPVFEREGIEFVEDFRDVCRRADVYINDLSSTLYEFLVTGKPVVVLNAPWFRREVNYGIRFWDYSNVGINVENPAELLPAIDRTLEEYTTIQAGEREQAVRDLYPYLGKSTARAVAVLSAYLIGLNKELENDTTRVYG
jgi:hypothetical protein